MTKQWMITSIFIITIAASYLYSAETTTVPQGGALAGNRVRVIISSDIGGGDEDDIQSMIHYLIYSDLFDTEGLISSPPQKGRTKDFLKVIDQHHPDTWMIFCDTTFRGWYMGGRQDGDLNNKTFMQTHIKGHGKLGDYCAPLKGGSIKMGDTPSVAYLLRGDPDDPTSESWGGQFILKKGRPQWWIDNPDQKLKQSNRPGAKTVNKWRQHYLRDWQHRMDRGQKPK